MISIHHHSVIGDIKKRLKSGDNIQSYAAVLIADKSFMRLVAAWDSSLVHPTFSVSESFDSKLELPEDLPEERVGDWLWSFYTVDFESWCAAAALPPAEAHKKKAEQLVRRCYVFPDGTVYDWLKKTVHTAMMNSLGAFKKGK